MLTRAKSKVREYALDVMTVAGLVLVAAGLGMYSPPLTPIVLGLGLLITVRLGGR